MEDGNGSHSSSSSFESLSDDCVICDECKMCSMPPPSYRAEMCSMPPPSYRAKMCSMPPPSYRPELCSMSPPSYRAGGPQKRCKLHGNFVIIRPKSSAQTIFHAESSAKIHEEEAICRFCYNKFKGENALMLICNCNKNTLAHESCSSTNQNDNNCDACGQELQKLHVTLHLEPFSNHSSKDEIKKRSSLVSRLRRIWLCSSSFWSSCYHVPS